MGGKNRAGGTAPGCARGGAAAGRCGAGGTNHAATAVVGKLSKLHSISLVVEDGQRQIWIPREVILLVELER